MKKLFLIYSAAILVLTACKKDSKNKPTPANQGTVLLEKVTSATSSDPFKGSTVAEFSYDGTTLTQAVFYKRGFYTDIETHKFNYDTQKRLIGSTITHSIPSETYSARSVISYNGNEISNIKFYSSQDDLNTDVNISYQNGRINEWTELYPWSKIKSQTLFSYDSKGNNFKQTFNDYENLIPAGITTIYNYEGFDNKKSVNSATPFGAYFKANVKNAPYLFFANSVNNAIKLNGAEYTYVYNDTGYPSSITWDAPAYPYPLSYKYEYIKVE